MAYDVFIDYISISIDLKVLQLMVSLVFGARPLSSAWPQWLQGSGVHPLAARPPNSPELAA